ncbi:MAG TPA: hypothetical protein VKN14_00970, partial [Flavobacteriaceae bacterium]|nr:hypothetical protein [Flavobacteriaceae bacterium]
MKKYIPLILFFFCLALSGQQTEYVDFKTAKAQISIKPDSIKVFGIVNYSLEILVPVDSIYIDAINMKFDYVKLNGEQIEFKNDLNKIWFKHNFKPQKIYNISFYYEAFPKKAMYFVGWDKENIVTSSDSLQTNCIEKKQIWTQGQGKYTSNWLPSIDDMNEKIEFDLKVNFDSAYEVIANGKLTDKQINESITTWHFDMQQPMSSYLVALAIGKYNKKIETSKSGIPLEMYYYPEDSNKVEPTYRYTKDIFDFLEDEIGFSYP